MADMTDGGYDDVYVMADVTDVCMAQERGVVAWSPQVWKRKVLLDSSTKSSEKPWYNAHLAITPVRASTGDCM